MSFIRRLSGALFALSLTFTAQAQAEQKQLKLYNWVSYIDQELIDEFTAQTGIEVIYDTFDSNDTLLAKTLAGNSGYDIVVPSDFVVTYLMQADRLHKLNKTKLPNYENIWPLALERLSAFEGINDYAVPYFWGTTGIGYDANKIKELVPDAPLNSLELIMNPKYAEKISQCGIYMIDNPSELLPIFNMYLGAADPESTSKEDLKKADDALKQIRPYIKKFHSSEYISALANGDACMALGWSGDFYLAQTSAEEAGRKTNLQYAIPKEGTIIWFDEFVILKEAENVEEAYAFINFMLDAKNSAKAANNAMYATANKAAFEYMEPKLRDNPILFPPEESLQNIHIKQPYTISEQKKIMRMWMNMKKDK